MGTTPDGTKTPRAVIHKQILDAAERRPNASLEGLAGQVSGASVGLVEEVLEEYGDPGESAEGEPGYPAAADGATEPEPEPEPAAIADPGEGEDSTEGVPDGRSGNQEEPLIPEQAREALQLLREDPGASQGDLAEQLGVAKSTINRWLHSIDGFDWEQRHDFVAEHLGGDGQPRLDRRVADLERHVTGGGSTLPPDLAHRVVHTCMDSGRFSEEEELRLVRAVMEAGEGEAG